MRKTIDKFDSLTGWAPILGGTVTAYKVNTNPDFIADNLTGSVIFSVPAGNLNKYVEKTITIDVTGYDEIVLWAWSRNKSGSTFSKPSDYSYMIDFGGTVSYYLPIKGSLSMIILASNGLTGVTRIRITPLHNNEDYLLISSCVAVKEQNPYDVYVGMKAGLEIDFASKYPNGLYVGKASGITGDKSITLTSEARDYVERYALIKIKDGVNSELHNIFSSDETSYTFDMLYDGKTLKYDYTNADVFLQFPVDFAQGAVEIKLPSVILTGITPELIRRGSALEDVWDTRKDDGTIQSRREGAIFKYNFLIDCEARHDEILGILSEITRKFLAKETLWVNNKKYRMVWEGSPTEVSPTEAFDMIPKMQFSLSIEMIEGLYTRQTLAKITTDNLSVNIS